MGTLVRLVFVCSCLISLNGIAAIYTWLDEDGNRHFSDQPRSEEARKLREEEVEVHNIDSGYPPGILPNPDREAQEREQSRRDADVAERRQRYCEWAQKRLKKLKGPVIFRDEDGNVVYKSERERAQMEREFRATMAERCPVE